MISFLFNIRYYLKKYLIDPGYIKWFILSLLLLLFRIIALLFNHEKTRERRFGSYVYLTFFILNAILMSLLFLFYRKKIHIIIYTFFIISYLLTIYDISMNIMHTDFEFFNRVIVALFIISTFSSIITWFIRWLLY